MRALALLVFAGCSTPPATDPAPFHPGIDTRDSSTYLGTAHEPAATELSFTDDVTGSRFNLLGQAYEGKLEKGKVQLGVLPAVTAFWFAWSTHYPDARVWNVGVANTNGEILANDECGVPCEEMIGACFGGKDCIPSIDDPSYVRAGAREVDYLSDSMRVLGVHTSEKGARAYPLETLWTHEIVNDVWKGDSSTVSYCPLTGSAVRYGGKQFGQAMEFGVSGKLFNSNLILYDRETNSLYGQMRSVGFKGDNIGKPLKTLPVIDTTWGLWRKMFPGTEVLATSPSGYPYGDYRTDHADTFMQNNPRPEVLYPLKSYAIGVTVNSETAVYAFDEMEEAVGSTGIVQDEVGGLPILVAFDAVEQTAIIYSRLIEGEPHEFTQE